MVNPLYQEVTRSRPIVKLFMATYLGQQPCHMVVLDLLLFVLQGHFRVDSERPAGRDIRGQQ